MGMAGEGFIHWMSIGFLHSLIIAPRRSWQRRHRRPLSPRRSRLGRRPPAIASEVAVCALGYAGFDSARPGAAWSSAASAWPRLRRLDAIARLAGMSKQSGNVLFRARYGSPDVQRGRRREQRDSGAARPQVLRDAGLCYTGRAFVL